MKICRFCFENESPRVGLIWHDTHLLDLTTVGIEKLTPLLELRQLESLLAALSKEALPRHALSAVKLLPPVEQHEVWAVGVTYIRSKKARMDESQFGATAYDRVYEAERPELFFKALGHKVVGTNAAVGIRRDGRWNVPEPELTFVLTSAGHIAGFTIGNDMSSRDIEGENLLYLPQAKVYDCSCAVGPWIKLGSNEPEARQWNIRLEILRGGQMAFSGHTSVSQIKRSFSQLVEYLFRSQTFPHGAVLLTGTGIVPPDDFTLQPRDRVRINIDGIGTLENEVKEV